MNGFLNDTIFFKRHKNHIFYFKAVTHPGIKPKVLHQVEQMLLFLLHTNYYPASSIIEMTAYGTFSSRHFCPHPILLCMQWRRYIFRYMEQVKFMLLLIYKHPTYKRADNKKNFQIFGQKKTWDRIVCAPRII